MLQVMKAEAEALAASTGDTAALAEKVSRKVRLAAREAQPCLHAKRTSRRKLPMLGRTGGRNIPVCPLMPL